MNTLFEWILAIIFACFVVIGVSVLSEIWADKRFECAPHTHEDQS